MGLVESEAEIQSGAGLARERMTGREVDAGVGRLERWKLKRRDAPIRTGCKNSTLIYISKQYPCEILVEATVTPIMSITMIHREVIIAQHRLAFWYTIDAGLTLGIKIENR